MEMTFDIAIGQEVWLMHKDRAVRGTVTKVWYTKFISPTNTTVDTDKKAYT